MLYNTAIPMFNSISTGAKYESNANCNIIKHKATAIITYIITSESDKFLVSSTVAVIPLILQFSFDISLSFSTVSIVVSSEIPSLNVTNTGVVLSLYNLSLISSGNISSGTSVPIMSVSPTTFSTFPTSLNCFSNSIISFDCIFSSITTENAPMSKSSANIFSPFIVSMLSGKYTSMS